jgi:hypothetical protein
VGRDIEVETVKEEQRDKEREQSEGNERGEEEYGKEDGSCERFALDTFQMV